MACEAEDQAFTQALQRATSEPERGGWYGRGGRFRDNWERNSVPRKLLEGIGSACRGGGGSYSGLCHHQWPHQGDVEVPGAHGGVAGPGPCMRAPLPPPPSFER